MVVTAPSGAPLPMTAGSTQRTSPGGTGTGSRYGGGYDPAATKFRVTVCDSRRKALTITEAPYELFKPGRFEWVDVHDFEQSTITYVRRGADTDPLSVVAPAAVGIIAVDPRVIPLGTKLYIPGYGEGLAADRGRDIKGNIIDVWMPSLAEARAWGTRYVTITIYD